MFSTCKLKQERRKVRKRFWNFSHRKTKIFIFSCKNKTFPHPDEKKRRNNFKLLYCRTVNSRVTNSRDTPFRVRLNPCVSVIEIMDRSSFCSFCECVIYCHIQLYCGIRCASHVGPVQLDSAKTHYGSYLFLALRTAFYRHVMLFDAFCFKRFHKFVESPSHFQLPSTCCLLWS